jgi:hypothetical protein
MKLWTNHWKVSRILPRADSEPIEYLTENTVIADFTYIIVRYYGSAYDIYTHGKLKSVLSQLYFPQLFTFCE